MFLLTKTLINFRIAAMQKVNKFNIISNIVKHIGLNIALVLANIARLSFGPCKKKIVFGPCKILFFKIVPDLIFVMICIRGT